MAYGYVDGKYGWIDEPGKGNPITGAPPAAAAPPPDPNVGLRGTADSYAQQRAGYAPRRVMQEGQVTYQNGAPGVMVKYDTPNGSSTEWTPLPPGEYGSNIDAFEFGQSGPGGAGGGAGGLGGSSDPFYQQIASMLKAQSQGDQSNTRAAIQKALIGFGLTPEGFEDKLGALDDVTKSLIAKNTNSGISTMARLLEGKTDAMKSLVSRLNATGLRRSGTKGAKLRKGQLDYDRLFQDSVRDLLGQIGSQYQNFTNNEYSRQLQQLQALQNAGTGYGNTSNVSSGGGGGGGGGGGFTPIYQGTWAEGIDTGGYVPGSGVITDFGPSAPQYVPRGGKSIAY